MASVSEQLFFYGEVVDPEPLTGFLAALEYADLLWSGSLVFTLVVLFTVSIAHWEVLASLAMKASKQLPGVCKVVVEKAGWLLQQVLTIQSFADLESIFYQAKSQALTALFEIPPVRWVIAVCTWFFPNGRGELTIIRASTALMCYIVLDSLILPPLTIRSIMMRNNMRDLFEEYKDYHLNMRANIYHLEAIEFVVICYLSVAACWYMYECASDTVHAHRQYTTSAPSLTTATTKKPLTAVAENKTLIRSAADAEKIDTLQITVRDVEGRLSKAEAEIKAANMRAEENCVKFKKEYASRVSAEETLYRACDEKQNLRDELEQKEQQLRIAQGVPKKAAGSITPNTQYLLNHITRVEVRLQNQINNNEKAEIEHKATVTELEKRLKNAQPEKAITKINELQKQLEEKDNSERELKKQIRQHEIQLQKQLKDKNSSERELKKQIRQREIQLQEQIEQRSRAEGAAHRELITLRGQYEAEVNNAVFQKLQRAQIEFNQKDEELRTLMYAKVDDTTQIQELKARIIGLEGSEFVLKDEVKDLEKTVNVLKADIRKEKDTNTSLMMELEFLREDSSDNSSSNQQSSSKTHEFNVFTHAKSLQFDHEMPLIAQAQPSEAEFAKQQIEDLKKSYEDVLAQERVQTEFLRKQIETTKEDKDTAKKRYNLTLGDLSRLNDKYIEYKKEAEAASEKHQAELNKLRSDITNNQEVQSLRQEIERLDNEVKHNQNIVKAAKNTARGLAAEIQKRNNEHAQDQVFDDQMIRPKKNPNNGSNATKLQQLELERMNYKTAINRLQQQLAQAQQTQNNGQSFIDADKQREIENLTAALKNESLRRKQVEVDFQDRFKRQHDDRTRLEIKVTKLAAELEFVKKQQPSPSPRRGVKPDESCLRARK